MPRAQLERVLSEELGADWRTQIAEFDFKPMAAASIGQVRPLARDWCMVVAVARLD